MKDEEKQLLLSVMEVIRLLNDVSREAKKLGYTLELTSQGHRRSSEDVILNIYEATLAKRIPVSDVMPMEYLLREFKKPSSD